MELLGDKLLAASGEVSTADALAGKGAVALYFSAHWCPPCRGFTPQLAGWYSSNLKAKGLEVVFVSSDRDEDAFQEYFTEMPWLALPYSDRAKKEELSKKFKVSGIPFLVILDADGKVITKDGRQALSEDPTGEEFPWKPKGLQDVLNGAKIIGNGQELKGESLLGKVFAFYFSAHWCPPCRGFTPQLAQWYTKDLKSKGLEVVFVSSDKDKEQFEDYFKDMPWLALDFEDRKRKAQLSNMFGVRGIPALVIIDEDGSVITKEGRGAVSSDPQGAKFPWYPPAVNNAKDGPGDINEVPSVVALCETSVVEEQEAIEEVMTNVAKQYIEKQKAEGEESPEFNFIIATEAAGVAPQLRKLMSLPALNPSKHEHPLEEKDVAGNWGCDGCNCSGASASKRYRCSQGCDFDFCDVCYMKSEEQQKALPAKLMLVDIPSDGAFYDGPSGKISMAVLEKFLSDYKAGSLERKQLS
jgi:nucleoredoxin